MDLLIVAVAVLVLLTVADARLWPDGASQNWRLYRGHWLPKRAIPRRRLRRLGSRTHTALGLLASRRRTTTGPLWWWE